MKFEKILLALREGKKIRRKDIIWQNYYGFLFISETENKIFSDNADNCDYKITKEDLNANDWEIVEEKKKVKLRDLTADQYRKWKNKNCTKYDCSKDCPFQKVKCYCSCKINDVWYLNKDLYSDKFLNQEIEVEE